MDYHTYTATAEEEEYPTPDTGMEEPLSTLDTQAETSGSMPDTGAEEPDITAGINTEELDTSQGFDTGELDTSQGIGAGDKGTSPIIDMEQPGFLNETYSLGSTYGPYTVKTVITAADSSIDAPYKHVYEVGSSPNTITIKSGTCVIILNGANLVNPSTQAAPPPLAIKGTRMLRFIL